MAAPTQLTQIKTLRWKCRTDLLFLTKLLLGEEYHLEEKTHRPVVNHLQQFPYPDKAQFDDNDKFENGAWKYTPLRKLVDLDGGRRMLLLDSRGFAKCVPGDQQILVSTGAYKRMDSITDKDRVLAIDNDFNLIWSSVQVTQPQGLQECYELKLRSGKTLKLSHNHPVRKIENWVETNILKIGDRIAISGNIKPEISSQEIPYAEILGWFLGDGNFKCQRITNADSNFIEKIHAATIRAGGTAITNYYKPNSNIFDINVRGLRPLWRSLNLLHTKSGDKFIPEIMFTAPKESIRQMLWALYACDGTCGKSVISYTSKSKQLIDDLQKLLLRFNIFSRMRVSYNKTYQTNYYGCDITSYENIERFFSEIGWAKNYKYTRPNGAANPTKNTVPKEWRSEFGKYIFGRGKLPETLKLKTGKPKSLVKYDISKSILKKYAEELNNKKLLQLSTDDIYWDEIVEINSIGKLETFDIQVEAGSFTVNDVITHNSTINCIAHTIQWILNYPNIAILVAQANLMKVHTVIKGVKAPFQYNETFRALFPEHCPQGKVDDWGTMDRFITEARTDMNRREPTVLGLSLDAGTAGLHFHVMKFSDIVERENSETPEQIAKVISRFQMFRNLLDRPDYWIDVEGTRYNYADLYGSIIESNIKRKKSGLPEEWKIFSRGCYVKDVSILDEGLRKEQRYTPEELDCPDLLTEQGKPISNWPEKFPVEFLEAERTDPISPDSELIFATQRKNNPMDVKDTARTFDPKNFRYITRENYKNIPLAYRQVTVDTASTQKIRSNYTAITIGAWSKAGKLYIEDVIHGKFLPEEIVFHLFNCAKRYTSLADRPQMYFIEETSYVQGLMPTINRVQDTGKLYIPESLRAKYGVEWNIGNIRLPITLLPRETTVSKQDRIRFSLQSPYSNGDLVFLDDISCIDYIRQEFARFPQFHTDDIIDTIADQYQQKEYFGRLAPRKLSFEEYHHLNPDTTGEVEIFGEKLGTHNIPSPYNTSRWGNL